MPQITPDLFNRSRGGIWIGLRVLPVWKLVNAKEVDFVPLFLRATGRLEESERVLSAPDKRVFDLYARSHCVGVVPTDEHVWGPRMLDGLCKVIGLEVEQRDGTWAETAPVGDDEAVTGQLGDALDSSDGMDALRANIGDGAFVRTSYPFTFAPMLYIFKNRPENHFNIYATAGFGLMASDITLYQDSRQERNQQFWEVLGQAGGGLELRFTRLALFADVRAIGMLLDQGSEPGKFYDGVSSGPIAPQSIGYKANLGAMLWF